MESRQGSLEIKLFELKKKVTDAFEIFDREGAKKINIRDVGTVIRSLGCCPSEAELLEIYRELDDDDTPGIVKFDKFLSFTVNILLENKFKPASKKMLINAFKVIDTENQGFISIERLQKLLTEEGEPFTQEELDEMLSVATSTDSMNYVEYSHLLLPERDSMRK